jgi:hypothetical protein
VVSVLATGPMGLAAAGSGPAEDDGFLWVIKIHPSEVVDLRHVKEPYTAWVSCFFGQISRPLFLTRDSPASLPDGSGC